MPSPEAILSGLAEIAGRWVSVAIFWHMLLAAALVLLARGYRPGHRAASLAIATLPASAALFAALGGNVVNAALLAATTALLVGLAASDRRGPVEPGPRWLHRAGLALVAYAWVYPHFLPGPPLAYLIAAPVGLLPCPSLAMATGLALLAGGLGSRAFRLTLAGVGLFYALFGTFRLGVTLDVGLLVGAALLAATAVRAPSRLALRTAR